MASDAEPPAESSAASGPRIGRRVAFASLLAVAAIAGIIASFCFIRYAAIDVPETTEGHIAAIEQHYSEMPAGQLVREWQEMEKFTPEITGPYRYQQIAAEKATWLRQGAIALAVAVASTLTAIALVAMGSRHAA